MTARKKKQRNYGEGGVREVTVRGKPMWLAELQVEGQPRRKYCKTMQEADIALDAMLKERNAGTLVPVEKITVETFLWRWFAEYRIDKSPMSVQAADYAVRLHLIPTIGHIRLQALKREHIQAAVTHWLEEGYAPNSIHLYYELLRSALLHAVLTENVGKSPCDRIKLPKVEKEMILLPSVARLKQFLHDVQIDKDLLMCHLVPFAMTMGLRRGELVALKWRDIDWERKTVTVRGGCNYVKGRGLILLPTK